MKISLREVTKSYGTFEALKGIDLVFEEGKFYGLLGPNGAGKTTLFNLLIKHFSPSSGQISWEEGDRMLSTKEFYRYMGMVYQDHRLDDGLTVQENLVARGALYGLSKKEVFDRMTDLQPYLDLQSIRHQRYGRLSGGQKRKVDIARALLPEPSLLLLDEPTTGLDPQSRHDLWKAIHQLNKEKKMTVILITHYLEEMATCDCLNVLISGQLYYSGDIASFINSHSRTRLELLLGAGQSGSSLSIGSFTDSCQSLSENELVFEGLTVDQMLTVLAIIQSQARVERFTVNYSNLETAYLNLLQDKKGDSHA